ncbi:hypothetical protein TWF481_000704 [Arthrobotrys musiformis]|uniref:HNH nuclease domain-containing protein n=1 Tax=Arthrobotrys musiformis TaxID=47236 RepID=A0AAV9WQ65_9PEZI
MSTSKDLTSPFKPLREKQALVYCKIFKAVNDKRLLSHRDKEILLGVLAFTTNEGLFKTFDKLSIFELKELAHLSEIALKNLRNWGGRPATTVTTPQRTPAGSRQGSRPQSPLGSNTEIESPSGTRRGRIAELQEMEVEPNIPVAFDNPSNNPLGLCILNVLGLKENLAWIPASSFSRSGVFGKDCVSRQQGFCAITGGPLSNNQQTAYIFPHSSLNPKTSATALTWRFLQIFLGTTNTELLASELWSEEKGVHTTKNGISIFPTLHTFFDKGKISLIPIRLTQGSHDYLDVEIGLYSDDFVVGRIRVFSNQDVEKQFIFEQGKLPRREIQTSGRDIKDGDMIRITTKDSEQYPLPSPVLLYWHRHLWSTLTSTGLSTPQSENRNDDLKDSTLENRTRTQEPEGSSFDDPAHDAGEGSSGGRHYGNDGADERGPYIVDYSNKDIQKILEQEARFFNFLRSISTPEDFEDDYSSE